jgi:hypothetical protein
MSNEKLATEDTEDTEFSYFSSVLSVLSVAKIRRKTMIQLKRKWKIPLMVFLVSMFFLTALKPAETGFKIISYKGTVKVKKNNKIIQLKQANILLKANHAVMVYRNSSITISLPGNKKKTLKGPFYSTVKTLEKPFDNNKLSFFENPGIWKNIQRVFDEEGDYIRTRSEPKDSAAFYKEIKKRVTDTTLKDKTPPAHKMKEMNAVLETIETIFNAFSKVKQILLKALVYKDFGMNKKALAAVFAHYETIRKIKEKQKEQKMVAGYIYNDFLPIVIHIHHLDDKWNYGINKKFSSGIDLWWAAFYYDGNKLILLEKTIDARLHPQKTYELRKNITINQDTASHCLFIVACPHWSQLETLDDIHAAKKELLADNIKETKVNTVRDWNKVTIKICLRRPEKKEAGKKREVGKLGKRGEPK